MSTALYRRYRPETFADVIGQEHVTGPLLQALSKDRVNHAYLFSGPRGCGKTTSARILARCLNCEQGPTPTPCGTCDSCVALARGGPGSIDVIEIDAASHGGVDDARDLRERATFGPASSRYKVYIIDEAHMVTPQGFNALLKVVEEPPEHVKFIFATTEPDKVIGTIRSRTHHYPFRLVPPAQLQDYLGRLCQAEGVEVAKGVLPLVVRAGAGSVRDSLSVLDQLMAGSTDEGVTYDLAVSLLGYTDAALLDDVVEAVAAGDGATVFRVVDRVVESGHDPRRFVEDLLERLRDLLVVAAVPDGAHTILRGLPEDQLDRMRHQAAHFGAAGLSRAADVVNAGLTEMTGASSPRLQLELICARVLLPGAEGESGYGARLDRIERRLSLGDAGGSAPVHAAPTRPAAPQQAAPQPAAPQPATSQRPAASSASTSGDTPGASPEPAPLERSRPAPTQPAAEAQQGPRPMPTRGAEPDDAPAPPAPGERAPTEAQPHEHPEPQPAAAAPATSSASSSGDTPGGSPETGALDGGGEAGAVSTEAIRRMWPDVLQRLSQLKRVTWTLVSNNAQVSEFDGRRLVLAIDTVGLVRTFRSGAHSEYVRQALIDVLGVDAQVEAVPTQEAGTRRPPAAAAPAAAPTDPAPAAQPVPSSPAPSTPAPSSLAPSTPARSGSGAPASAGPRGRAPRDPQGGSAPTYDGAPPEPPSPEDDDDPWAAPPAEAPARAQVAAPARTGAPRPDSTRPGAQRPGQADPSEPRRPVVSLADDVASRDDEDAEDSGMVGRPVVERLLGGRVIDEQEG